MNDRNTKETLLNRIEKKGDCWEWKGAINKGGYGVVGYDNKLFLVHRLFYSLFVGPIPKGLLICHKCDNRKCANPDHLFVGTYKDNTQDMLIKGRGNRGKRK